MRLATGLLAIACGFFSVQVPAQSVRLLIVGDSWAAEQWGDGSHARVFAANGFGDILADGSQTTESGSTAEQWSTPARLQVIADALAAQPSIDTVQLTLGGNDFLDVWNTGMSLEDEAALMLAISDRLDTISAFILDQRPDIEIVLSFYDYPNFVDTLGGLVGFFFCRPLWEDLGEPTPTELNIAARAFEAVYADLALANPRIHHVAHFGLMQFNYGFPSAGIAPGDIAPPGDLTRPSPLASMRNHGLLGRDCFHLTPAGYDILVQNLIDGYLGARFTEPLGEHVFSDSFEAVGGRHDGVASTRR